MARTEQNFLTEFLVTTESENGTTAIWLQNNGYVMVETRRNSPVDACNVNAFKARLDKFWQHQAVKIDFTVDLTGTGNRSEEVLK